MRNKSLFPRKIVFLLIRNTLDELNVCSTFLFVGIRISDQTVTNLDCLQYWLVER